MTDAMKNAGASMLRWIHNPPLFRTEVCAVHSPYESLCHFRDMWSDCPACAAVEADREAAKAEARKNAERARKWQAMIGEAGIPERFQDRRLSAYVAETDGQRRALQFARAYAADFERIRKTGRSAVFIGSPGTGKTHLAVGIGLEAMERGATVLFTTVLRAVRRVKDTWSRGSVETESEAVEALVFPDLLILDEVGVQFGSDAEHLILFDTINSRYERRKPTILLSNLAINDAVEAGRTVPGIRAYLGERVFDRLREDGGQFVVFDWPSHRRKVPV